MLRKALALEIGCLGPESSVYTAEKFRKHMKKSALNKMQCTFYLIYKLPHTQHHTHDTHLSHNVSLL